jgi:hypothetical protein
VEDMLSRYLARRPIVKELKGGLGVFNRRMYLAGIVPSGHPLFGGKGYMFRRSLL